MSCNSSYTLKLVDKIIHKCMKITHIHINMSVSINSDICATGWYNIYHYSVMCPLRKASVFSGCICVRRSSVYEGLPVYMILKPTYGTLCSTTHSRNIHFILVILGTLVYAIRFSTNIYWVST